MIKSLFPQNKAMGMICHMLLNILQNLKYSLSSWAEGGAFHPLSQPNGCVIEKANIKVLRVVTSLGRNNYHIEWSNSKTEFNSDIGAIPI